ncbi:MAG: hypothetical protein ABIA75_02710 [Candidatus Neomarinimicrobiota bacterium]
MDYSELNAAYATSFKNRGDRVTLIAFNNDILSISTGESMEKLPLNELSKIWITAATEKKLAAPYVAVCGLIGALYSGYHGAQLLDDWFGFEIKDTNEKTFVPVGMWLIISSAPGTIVGYMVGTVIGSLSTDKYNISDMQKLEIREQRRFIESLID